MQSNSKKIATQHHEVGLPSVWSEDSLARPASASVSGSLFLNHNQGAYERSNPTLSSQFNSSNDFVWDSSQQNRPKTTESQSSQLRDPRFHSGQSKARPLSSVRSSYGSSTSQNVEDILSSHQMNQLHKSKRFLSSR